MAFRRFLRSIFRRGSTSKASTISTSTTDPSISFQACTSTTASSSTALSTAPSTSPNSSPPSSHEKSLAIKVRSPLEEAIAALKFVKRLPLEELGLIGGGFSDLGGYSSLVQSPHSDHTSSIAAREGDVLLIETGSSFPHEGLFALSNSEFSTIKSIPENVNGSNTTSLDNYKLDPVPFSSDIESEMITVSSTESTTAVEKHNPLTKPRPRQYVGRHRVANATQPTLIPTPTPTSTSIFLSERLEEIQQLAWSASNIELEAQAEVLDMQDDMFCTDPGHTLCSCQRWRLGNYLFFARNLTAKETRVITRAAILVDICLYATMESVSVEDFLLFKAQLIPEVEGVPKFTHEVFQLLASKYFCRGVFNAEQKQMLIGLQPCFDDDYVEMADDPKPVDYIEGLEVMTDDEFAQLPEYWEVADSQQYNSRFKRPHTKLFRASDASSRMTSGTSIDGPTGSEVCIPSIDEQRVGNK